MATAIKLGKRPPHLEATVSFPMPDPDTGKPGTGSLICRFKYRTQTEFGAWLDAKAQAHGLDAPAVTNNADQAVASYGAPDDRAALGAWISAFLDTLSARGEARRAAP